MKKFWISWLAVLSLGLLATNALAADAPLATTPGIGAGGDDSSILALTPKIGVNPTSLDFGKVCLSQCADRVINIFNDVSDPASILTVTSLQVSAGYSLVNPPALPFTIPGNGSQVAITIRFCPQAPGVLAGTFSITAGAPVLPPNPRIVTLTGTGNRPPVCNANGPYSGNVGQAISFNGSGSSDPDGDPLTYAWTFGDGGTGSGPTPSHTYTTGGIFTVALTVTDNCGVSTSCQTTADINRLPICNANGPYSGNVGQPVTFNGSGSSDPDGTIVSYAWTFGDGGTGTGPTPSHTYATGGVFTVTLTVTDNRGASTNCQTTADINRLPICNAGGPYTGTVGAPVAFNGTGSSDPDGTIVSYAWTFGDGGTGTGPTPSHTYATGGVFTVGLTVTDNRGASSTCQTTADINARPICNAGGPYTGTVGAPVAFNGTGSSDPDGTIVSYAWTFGDGGTGTGPTPSHTYATGGLFTVTLTVTDNRGATSTCETTADINVPPVCNAGGPYSGQLQAFIAFNGSGSNDPDGTIVSYAWTFGDGGTGSGPAPQHIYGTPGVFTVTLTVTDNDGASSTCQTTCTVNAPPVCDAGGPYAGLVNQPIAFDGTGSSDPDGTITLYEWNFGDGGSATGPTPSHTYTTTGTFTVTLCVTDNGGAPRSCCNAQVAVGAGNIPPICDAGGPYTGIAGQAVAFNGTGSNDPDGSIVSYAWNFGDGGTGTGPTPSHTYASAGNYIVTLCVVDNQGAQSCCETTAAIQSANQPPVCDAGGPYAGVAGQPVAFNGTGSSDPDGTIVLYEWNFGDGGTATGPTPSHTYASAGTYVVTLCVTDNAGARSCCETQAVISAANIPPNCNAGGPYSGDLNATILFNGTGSSDPDGTIVLYEWNFGDGGTANGAQVSHAYAAPGTYTVTLCVTDDDGARSCCETTCEVFPPSAVEIASFTAASENGTVTLTWRTAAEQGNLGFNIERAASGSSSFARVNEQLITANGDTPGAYSYTDRTAQGGATYSYRLVALDLDGSTQTFGPLEVMVERTLPATVMLGQNRPNPFNPATVITFALPEGTRGALRIYDAQGQLVRTLVDGDLAAGDHAIEWNGTDDRGSAVGSGVYLYRLELGSKVLQNKMVLMK